MKKITAVIDGFGSGGAQRVMMNLLTYWSQVGYSLEVITWQKKSNDFYEIPSQIKRTYAEPPKASPNFLVGAARNIVRLKKLRSAIKKSECDSILSFQTQTNILTIISCFGFKKNVVVSERTDPRYQHLSFFWKVLRWVSYRFASTVTANSDNSVKELSKFVANENLKKIQNPVIIPENTSRPKNKYLILSVGRLIKLKGHNRIIECFLSCCQEIPRWTMSILGEGPCRISLEQQIDENGGRGIISLPGNVPDPNPFYQSAGMFIMASDYEGTPNALLEAMAHGLPCIVPDCLPGALEHVEDGVSGLVYPAGNVESLKECILTLAADPDLRERLGKEARKRMEEFSIDKIARQWEEILFPNGTEKSDND